MHCPKELILIIFFGREQLRIAVVHHKIRLPRTMCYQEIDLEQKFGQLLNVPIRIAIYTWYISDFVYESLGNDFQ